MPFTFPNSAAATYVAQAEIFQTDIDVLLAGFIGTGRRTCSRASGGRWCRGCRRRRVGEEAGVDGERRLNADVLAQVRVLTRECNAVIRLLLDHTDDTTGT